MQHSRKRKLWAKIWIAVTFLLLMAAEYFFLRFCRDSMNTYLAISWGMTFGCTLWTTVLLGAMWMRYGWARYVLVTLICLAIIGFGAIILVMRSESVAPLTTATRAVVIGMFFYAMALIPLGASHALRHFLGPRTGSR